MWLWRLVYPPTGNAPECSSVEYCQSGQKGYQVWSLSNVLEWTVSGSRFSSDFSSNFTFSIDCKFEGNAWLDFEFEPCILKPSCIATSTFVFKPSHARSYSETVEFVVNGLSTYNVEISGQELVFSFFEHEQKSAKLISSIDRVGLSKLDRTKIGVKRDLAVN